MVCCVFDVVVSLLTYCVQIWLQECDVPVKTTVNDHWNQRHGARIESLTTACHRGCTVYVQTICVSNVEGGEGTYLLGDLFQALFTFGEI